MFKTTNKQNKNSFIKIDVWGREIERERERERDALHLLLPN